jgi:hypothetical protein
MKMGLSDVVGYDVETGGAWREYMHRHSALSLAHLVNVCLPACPPDFNVCTIAITTTTHAIPPQRPPEINTQNLTRLNTQH